MNEFDQFVKHGLRVKHYMRYTDDFVIVSEDKDYLQGLIPKISKFLETQLELSLHPNKVFIRKYRQGIDFLGYISLPDHIATRTKTRQRIDRKLHDQVKKFKTGTTTEETLFASLNSYLGVFSHADAYEVAEEIKSRFWFWMSE